MKLAKLRMLLAPLMILALLLTVAPVPARAVWPEFGDYGLAIGCVAVTSENKSKLVAAINAVEPGSASGYARYDDVSNTLTLENFHYEGKGYQYGSVRAALLMVDTGVPFIYITGDNSFNLTTYGDDNGTVATYDDTVADIACGAYYTCDLYIKRNTNSAYEEDTISFIGPNSTVQTYEQFGLDLTDSVGLMLTNGTLEVNDCTVYAYGGDADCSTGLLIQNGFLSLVESGKAYAVGASSNDSESRGAVVSRYGEYSGRVILYSNCELVCQGGYGVTGSTGLSAKDIWLDGNAVLTTTAYGGDTSAKALFATDLHTGGGKAEITAFASADYDSTAIDIENIDASGAVITADGGTIGIYTSDADFSDCDVTATGIEGIQVYGDSGSLNLYSGSVVKAVGKDDTYESCGVYMSTGSPSVGAGCELFCSGGVVEEGSGFGSYGLRVGTDALTVEKDTGGLLIAQGYTRAVTNSSKSVKVTAGYIRVGYNTHWGEGCHATLSSGSYPATETIAYDTQKYLYARGAVSQDYQLSGHWDDEGLSLIVESDWDIIFDGWVVAAAYDGDGKFLAIWTFQLGEWWEDELLCTESLSTGLNVYSFAPGTPTWNALTPGASIRLFLIGPGYAPLCPSAVITYSP